MTGYIYDPNTGKYLGNESLDTLFDQEDIYFTNLPVPLEFKYPYLNLDTFEWEDKIIKTAYELCEDGFVIRQLNDLDPETTIKHVLEIPDLPHPQYVNNEWVNATIIPVAYTLNDEGCHTGTLYNEYEARIKVPYTTVGGLENLNNPIFNSELNVWVEDGLSEVEFKNLIADRKISEFREIRDDKLKEGALVNVQGQNVSIQTKKEMDFINLQARVTQAMLLIQSGDTTTTLPYRTSTSDTINVTALEMINLGQQVAMSTELKNLTLWELESLVNSYRNDETKTAQDINNITYEQGLEIAEGKAGYTHTSLTH